MSTDKLLDDLLFHLLVHKISSTELQMQSHKINQPPQNNFPISSRPHFQVESLKQNRLLGIHEFLLLSHELVPVIKNSKEGSPGKEIWQFNPFGFLQNLNLTHHKVPSKVICRGLLKFTEYWLSISTNLAAMHISRTLDFPED
ncbi:hypothetical protein SADUNF_Sadunf03G0015400 [Salix dunnii]|uniref:Uncharacterized protein n=1 Tax=Salix dunnii TaxID=1413687 RepID=A0A835KDC7_9ROSI|nr:hypothetical protein SADUNF_Sadunf03G0015400 [Salix dunnii]